jgi:hypothetical protein
MRVAPRNVASKVGLDRFGVGSWDYKASYSSEISVDYLIAQNAGHFNFGGMGAALGFKLEDLLRGAGGENVLNNVLNAGYWSGLVQGRFGVPGMVAEIAVHMLFLAGAHSYEISREIAVAANATGLDGIVYPSTSAACVRGACRSKLHTEYPSDDSRYTRRMRSLKLSRISRSSVDR